MIKDYMHKASSYIVNQIADSSSICTIAIGYNKGWKQDTNMGKANNQKFTSIPYLQFVSMIEYKAKLKGIRTARVNELYTSKLKVTSDDLPASRGLVSNPVRINILKDVGIG